MRIFIILAALVGAALVASPVLAADLAIYGKLPSLETADLSPDGRKLVMVRTNGEQRQIILQDLDTRQILARLDGGAAKVRDVQWADNDHLVITTSRTTSIAGVDAPRSDWAVAILFNLKTGKNRPLLTLRDNRETLNVVLERPMVRTVDGDTVVFTQGISFPDDQGVRTIFSTNLSTGRTVQVFAGSITTRDYLISPEGKIGAELRYDPHKDIFQLRLRGEKGFRDAMLPAGLDGLSLAGFGRDGKTVLVYYWPKDGERILAEASVESADWRKVDGGDDATALFSARTGQLTGFFKLKGDVETYSYVDAKDQRSWNGIQKAYPGERVSPISFSADRRRVIASTDSPTEGPAYALVDLDKAEARYIGNVYEGLKPEHVSPVQALSYKAADGQAISAYLTVPAGKAAKDLPLIVLPHGGPAARDTLGFDWWSQALASRGYAVLRPNFRGSSGYGEAFLEAGFGEFGRKMQTDLSDGVRHLAKEGVIDPKRVCIVGASYGGYAALAGAALDTGVYRCAVSVAGPADLRRMLVTERDDSGVSAFRFWKRFMGVDGIKDPDLSAISPVVHAGEVTIPLMLIHGKDDTVVLYEQSRLMADAMKKAGKTVDFITLDSEDHWLSRGATRLKMLESVAGFVEKNNPPG